MSGLWNEAWFLEHRHSVRDVWRGVEAQHVIATLRVVDSVAEQELLEEVLESSKPAIPRSAQGLPYLLFTPFRYRSPRASRFREAGTAGVFYAADEEATVAAEVGYWRWRFMMDSEGLRAQGQVITEHTFLQARISGQELDLTQAPWNEHRDSWRDPESYAACHELVRLIRSGHPNIATLRYESARREGGACNVVFDPQALSMPSPHAQQTWTCKATPGKVIWAHRRDLLEFEQHQ
ncbi:MULTISPECIES: RES family NAD+ phosphorylase [Ramlibacter]|uniref:RES family NAD+ phosphorylase n=1 Tax=Ramlibacter aquaticus TaxID=2780094 RepID=A0ABR9SCK9_9BURK|nr:MULTISPECIES: RES family NAD+ phosphorylase [Ramlibacter]MBE7940093.1 RES family NAD+ phosphorylase [Ramlibacter aquaticus]